MFKFFLFFLFSTSLFAVDSGTDWWIYSYEDINTLKSVFNYLAMINQDNGYMETLRFAIYTGMVFSLFIKFFDITAIPRYFVTAIATMMVVFGTSATVHVVNVKSYDSLNPNIDNYAKIDNVPYIFAILTSCFSNIGYNSALLIETIFTSITDNEQIMETSFLKAGHMGTYKILTKLDAVDMFSINDNGKLLNKLLDNYLQSCIYDIALSLDPRIKNEITNQSDFMTYLSPSSSSNETIKTIGTIGIQKYDGTSTTCNALFSQTYDLFNLIKNDSKLYTAAKKLASKDTSNFDKAASSVVSMMNQSDLTGTQAKITTYIMNNGLMSAIENSWQNYGVGISSATNSSAQAGFGAGLAISQMQLAGKVKAKSASMILPSMHSVLQAVMYVLFPIILIVQLFAGGIKIIQNYVLGLLWLELWIPSYSVLNYFTTREAQTEAINRLINSTNDTPGAYGILTMANANEIYNTIANEASIAADMYWMIPALAGFILFASFHSISGITGAVAGAVGQYSSTQTLNEQRSEFAALDSVNEGWKKQNPLYTGDVGSLKQMQSQLQYQGAASVAAGKLLGAGSNSIDSIGKTVSTDMFSGMKDMSSTMGEQKQTTGGGPISNAKSTYQNTGTLSGADANGKSYAVNSNNNLLHMVEDASNTTTQAGAYSGSMKKSALENTFGSLEKGLESTSFVEENTKADSLVKQIDEAGDKKSLVNINSEEAKASTAMTKAKIEESQNNNMSLSEYSSILSRNSTSKSIETLDAEKNARTIFEDGSLKEKGKDIIQADTQTKLESTNSSIQAAGGVKELVNINERKAGTDTLVESAKQKEGDKNGGYENIMTGAAKKDVGDKALQLESLENTGLANNGSYNEKGKLVMGENLKNENLSKIGKSNTYIETPDNKETLSAQALESRKIEEGTNLIKQAENAHNTGITKDSKVSSLVSAQGQNYSAVNQKGTKIETITDADNQKMGTREEKITDEGVLKQDKSANGTVVKSELNADVVDTAKNDYNRSKNINTTDTVDSSIIRKDNWTVEGKTSIDINQMYKRTEGKDAYDSFEKTMISINNADSVKNLFSNPIGGITDIYSSIKSEYNDSIGKDGEERTNFEPDTINYLEKRQEQFFDFSTSKGTPNNAK